MTGAFLSVPRYDLWLPCHIHLRECLLIMDSTTELQRRIQAMEMNCFRKILRISYKDHATNEGVRAKTLQAIGPHEHLLTIVERRKLQRYEHASRSSGLAKTTWQGTVNGGKRQERQWKWGRQHQGMDRPGVRQVP